MLSAMEMYAEMKYKTLDFNKFDEIFIISTTPSISHIRSMKNSIFGKFLMKLFPALMLICDFLMAQINNPKKSISRH